MRGFGEKTKTLGLDAACTQGAENVREPFGAVNKGKAPAIAQNALCRGAHVLKRAGYFLPRRPARFAVGAFAAAGGKIRRVGDHIVDAAGERQGGGVAQVARVKNGAPLPAVFQKALARERCRGRGKLHIFNDEGILARKQERAEKPCAAAEVADVSPRAGRAK